MLSQAHMTARSMEPTHSSRRCILRLSSMSRLGYCGRAAMMLLLLLIMMVIMMVHLTYCSHVFFDRAAEQMAILQGDFVSAHRAPV